MTLTDSIDKLILLMKKYENVNALAYGTNAVVEVLEDALERKLTDEEIKKVMVALITNFGKPKVKLPKNMIVIHGG